MGAASWHARLPRALSRPVEGPWPAERSRAGHRNASPPSVSFPLPARRRVWPSVPSSLGCCSHAGTSSCCVKSFLKGRPPLAAPPRARLANLGHRAALHSGGCANRSAWAEAIVSLLQVKGGSAGGRKVPEGSLGREPWVLLPARTRQSTAVSGPTSEDRKGQLFKKILLHAHSLNF